MLHNTRLQVHSELVPAIQVETQSQYSNLYEYLKSVTVDLVQSSFPVFSNLTTVSARD